MGMEAITTLDDAPEELDDIDPLLAEAANITFDLIETGKYAIRQN